MPIVVPINAVFVEDMISPNESLTDECREAVNNAELVFAHDAMSGDKYSAYGI